MESVCGVDLMAWTQDVSFNQAYARTVQSLYQSDPDQVRDSVRVEMVEGKSLNVERLSGVNMTQITARHQDTPFTPMTFSRRRLTILDYAASELIDQLDRVKMIISPQNDITQGFVKAWHRRTARTVLAAALGNASAIDASETASNIALPASQAIANGGTNMTMAKVRQARRLLMNAGVPGQDLYAAVSAFAIEKLLSDTTVTSSDFSSLNALASGTIPPGATWMGFKWIVIPDADPDDSSQTASAASILPKSGNIRSCVFYHKNALVLGIGKDFSAEVDALPTKLNSTQILVKTALGAVRVLDFGVVQVDIDESA